VIVDDRGRYQGVLDFDQLNDAIRAMRSQAVATARTEFADEDAAAAQDTP
jgi:osmoprotectant transport system ATP-binding protein